MRTQIIFDLNSKLMSENIGNKAKNLLYLRKINKILIPKTWVIPWDVQAKFRQHKETTIQTLNDSLIELIDPKKKYAVRSSSTIEDDTTHSYAGLFNTFLNVGGNREILIAVREIWESLTSERIQKYLEKLSLEEGDIKMAILLQEMVHPVYSGVCFTRNPMTGTHEIIIEAVKGEGSALVQDGVTPERWIAHSAGWLDKPDNSTLPSELINKILKDVKRIAKKVKVPIDLEWVFDGKDLYWVQLREITTLEDLTIYSNRISRDVMPGIIHPLIWSINVPLINTQWLRILEEMVGKLPVEPQDLAKSFYYRSYFNISTFGEVFNRLGLPQESLEIFQGVLPKREGRSQFKPSIKMLKYIPKFLRFLIDKLRFGNEVDQKLPQIEDELDAFTCDPSDPSSLEELVEEINKLFDAVQGIVYFNIVLPLLTTAYIRLFEKQLTSIGVEFKQFDLFKDFLELDAYNPHLYLSELKQGYDQLSDNAKTQLALGHIEFDSTVEKEIQFQNQTMQFIEKFGHLSDNGNNFTAKPWRENPEFVHEMIRDFKEVPRGMKSRIDISDLRVKGLRKRILRFLFDRSRKYALYRDQVSYHYMYGYGLFRPYFLKIADWMVVANWLDDREDIFYLYWDEIKDSIRNMSGTGLSELVNLRQNEMSAFQNVILPEVIYGDDAPPVFSESFDKLKGTPTSQGYYDGVIKVIRGRDDFDKVDQGDVIVIPYSDVGWTPLFSRAGAVIAESGGILSHSSIIAREYQIPAVVSVSNCMQLADEQRVSVNGFTGEIVLLDD